MYTSMGGWIIFGVIALVSWLVQLNLTRKFEKYSKVAIASGLTGAQVAEKMLKENGLYDVSVTHVSGTLTDHYNPATKTVNLSDEVYSSYSVAAAAVAAHECGHAVQHARAYTPLQLRSALVPAVSFSSKYVSWILLAGMLLLNIFPYLLLLGIVMFAMTTIFSFVTLPVEIDASRRATLWLQEAGITSPTEHPMAVSALRSAAYTYVSAALGSLATLFYYLMIFLDRR
ncbi:MAG: zinc metallopeptidase [Alloprevotella sp.]|nr:zinc metallopeptidase [Alloprevotella sp.]